MNFIKKYALVLFVAFVLCAVFKPVLCPFIFGGLFFTMGLGQVLFFRKIAKEGISSTGEIISYRSDGDGGDVPLIEFITMEGEVIKEEPYVYVTIDFGDISVDGDMVNQSVPVLYDPGNPGKFIIENERQFSSLVAIVCILIGLFFIGPGISSLSGYVKM